MQPTSNNDWPNCEPSWSASRSNRRRPANSYRHRPAGGGVEGAGGDREDTATFKQQSAELHALMERLEAGRQSETQAAAAQLAAVAQQLAELRAQPANHGDTANFEQHLTESRAMLEEQRAQTQVAGEQIAAMAAHLPRLSRQVAGRDESARLEQLWTELLEFQMRQDRIPPSRNRFRAGRRRPGLGAVRLSSRSVRSPSTRLSGMNCSDSARGRRSSRRRETRDPRSGRPA